MVQIRENWQRLLTSHDVDTQLLCAGLALGTVMYVGITNLLGVKEPAP